jgi:hypothetical protein
MDGNHSDTKAEVNVRIHEENVQLLLVRIVLESIQLGKHMPRVGLKKFQKPYTKEANTHSIKSKLMSS